MKPYYIFLILFFDDCLCSTQQHINILLHCWIINIIIIYQFINTFIFQGYCLPFLGLNFLKHLFLSFSIDMFPNTFLK